jgi:hypothetical protein
LGNYNGKNKERRKLNQRPIEQRSEKVCTIIIEELFNSEINLVKDVLSEKMDYSKIDVSLNNGLVLQFEEKIDKDVISALRSAFHTSKINHKFNNNQELIIYK